MNTVTAYGSVERYAEIIRENSRSDHDVYVSALAIIDVTSKTAKDLFSDSEQLAHVRNVVTAARLVQNELRQAGR